MTKEEAAKKLEDQKLEYLDNYVDYAELAEAYDMAIAALMTKPCVETIFKNDIVANKIIKQKVDEILASYSVNRWISVRENGNPKKDGEYLITVNFMSGGGYLEIARYAKNLYEVDKYNFRKYKNKSGWYNYDSKWGYFKINDPVAYMSLPEPYEGY